MSKRYSSVRLSSNLNQTLWGRYLPGWNSILCVQFQVIQCTLQNFRCYIQRLLFPQFHPNLSKFYGKYGNVMVSCIKNCEISNFGFLANFLMSFGARVSKWPVTPKRLVVERNGVKLETRGQLLYKYRVIWRCSKSICGHLVHLSQNGVHLEKGWS